MYNRLQEAMAENMPEPELTNFLKKLPKPPEILIDEMTDTQEEVDYLGALIVRCGS